jgi:hypothetical protein
LNVVPAFNVFELAKQMIPGFRSAEPGAVAVELASGRLQAGQQSLDFVSHGRRSRRGEGQEAPEVRDGGNEQVFHGKPVETSFTGMQERHIAGKTGA